ncbi:hypothetical protein FWF89_01885 [Candidatus Saccharibacteria bacterium]|nr:hypothetical protein [Candidatus Saccharibacteria bacterium]
MKKLRIISFIITISLAMIIVAGVIIQIFSARPLLDITYEVIAFIFSGICVIVALLSQISAYRERKEYSRIIHELNEVIADTEEEKAINEAASKKLDELIALDHRIYGRITGKTKRKAKK